MKEAQFKQLIGNCIDRKYCCRYLGVTGKFEPQQVIDYVVGQDEFDPLTQEQWRKLFCIFNSPFALAKWIIEEHYNLLEDSIGLIAEVFNSEKRSRV